MKKTRLTALLLAMVMALAPWLSLAGETLLMATVSSGEEIAVTAPHSGEVSSFTLRVGDTVNAGGTLFIIKPRSMYAEADGTVAIVHAGSGQSASGAVSRYGAVLLIEHENRYELVINMRTGYNSAENHDLWVGTPVYLRAVNGNHFGLGTITSVSGSSFKVSVESGDLLFDEEARAYRTLDYDAKALLGRAKPSLVSPHQVAVSGTILDMKAQRGDKVRQGDLLFTYVPDALSPGQRAQAGRAIADEALVVSAISAAPGASVQQGQLLAKGYPLSAMQLTAQAEEKDISSFTPGTQATVYFEELGLGPIPAQVKGTSALGMGDDPSDSTARYEVTFSFEAPPEVLFGMHATVQVP